MLIVFHRPCAAYESGVLPKNENLDKFCNHVDNSKLRNKSDLRTQIIADAASTKTEIFTSKHPSRTSYEFYERWAKYLSDKGINLLVV